MIEPDFSYETGLNISLEDATQNLTQNLHLKWQYALLYIDRYSDEQDLPVSVVSGLYRKSDSEQYHVRIEMTSIQKGTHLKFHVWRVITSGWPFPSGVLNTSTQNKTVGVDIIDNMLEFCQMPYEDTGSLFSWLRNMFDSKVSSRNYKQTD